MKKCLLFVRTSTNRQELESQLKETKEFAQSLGYDEFVVLKRTGASAFKVADEYLEMIEEMKSTLEKDNNIKAVVVWAMNRLFRNDTIAVELKDWFVENKIQLHVKEPRLTLLEEDGTLGAGNEMLFHFFAVFNKQQIQELKSKSSRAKTRDKAAHKYLGGKVIFGYDKDSNNFMVVNDKEAKIVKDIYEQYATGQYSFTQLAKEMNERYGTSFAKYRIYQILHQTYYYDNTHYPAIISEDLFNKCKNTRDNSAEKPQGWKHKYFGSKLIKCPVCGLKYIADVDSYRCQNKCSRQLISLFNMDGLLWLIASHLEGEFLVKNTEDELTGKITVLRQKIDATDITLAKYIKAKERLKEAYLNSIIDKEEYSGRASAIDDKVSSVQDNILRWTEEINNLNNIIEQKAKGWKRLLEISDSINSSDEGQMQRIVRKWITGVEITEDKLVTVHTVVRDYKARYSRYNTRSRWSTLYGHQLVVSPVMRLKEETWIKQPTKFTPDGLSSTLAWLNGSTIV